MHPATHGAASSRGVVGTTTSQMGERGAEQALPSPLRMFGRALLVGLGYYLCARLGLLIPYVGTHISLIWLPTGVALAAYLRWGGAMAPAIYVAALLANLAIAGPVWVSVGIAAGNALGPWISARLLRRWQFDTSLVRRRDLGIYLAAAALGMVVTASNGTVWLLAGGALPAALWGSAWVSWWIGDSVGALLGGVPLVALNGRTFREAFHGERGPINVVLLAAVAASAAWAFSGWLGPGSALLLPMLALPFFLSAVLALRAGALAASLAALLVAGMAAWGTARGVGPFAGFDAHAGLLALWSYVAAQACTSLLIWMVGAELLSSRRQFEALFEHADEGILVIGPDGRLQALNPAASQLLAVNERMALGRPIADLPHGHGEALGAWLDAWQAEGATHAPHDLLLPREEGAPLAIELQAARYHDAGGQWHTHLVMRDVSARRDAEARIAGSERRLRAITDNVPALICYIDRELRFRFVNATYEAWFGVSPAAMIGRPVDEFLAPGHLQARRSNMEQVLGDGERLSFEFMTELNGRKRHLRSLYVADRGAGGQVQGVYVLTMDVTEQKAIEASLNKLVRFDHLTGLLNRQPFEDRLDEAVRGTQRGQGSLAVLFIDVDHFKAINDNRGHAAGDAVLKEFARRLQRAVRGSDTVARLAGDEFVVLLERVRGPEQAEQVAAKVCAEMQAPFVLDDGYLSVSASVGAAWCDGARVLSASRMMAAADAALYEAKRAGRNTYRLRRCDEVHAGDTH